MRDKQNSHESKTSLFSELRKSYNYYEVYDHIVKVREIGLEKAFKELKAL